NNPFGLFLEGRPVQVDFRPDTAVISTVLAFAGIAIAWSMYGGGKTEASARLSDRLRPLHDLLSHHYYVDNFYGWLVSHVVLGVGWVATRFDARVVDGAVNGTGAVVLSLGGS